MVNPRFGPGHSYTAPMRVSTSLLIIFFVSACAGNRPTKGETVVLPRGEGIYTSRYNPVSFVDPEALLDVEIKTALGWERVRLEDSEAELDLSATLIRDFTRSPHGTRLVRGDFTGRSWAFGQGHGSRVFVIVALDPFPNAEDPNRSISP